MHNDADGPGQCRRIGGLLGAGGLTALALLGAPGCTPVDSAQPCPDVEIVFARATDQPPGVGGTGQEFVDSLRSHLGGRSVDVYAVDYPASADYPTLVQGVIDARSHIRATAANCPKTNLVLGGFSQGAAVIGYIATDAVPAGGTPPSGFIEPIPPEVADHVAAVALFGKPSNVLLDETGLPPIVIGSRYVPRTIDMCNADDPVCDPDGSNEDAHGMYGNDGLVDRAAEFAAQRIRPPGG